MRKYFCLHTRQWRNIPCVHGTCHLMDFKRPPSISEEKEKAKK